MVPPWCGALRPGGGRVLVPPGRPVRDQLAEHDQHQAEHDQPDQDQAPPEDREAQRVAGPTGRAGLVGRVVAGGQGRDTTTGHLRTEGFFCKINFHIFLRPTSDGNIAETV